MTWFGADGIGSEGPNIVARNEVALFQDFLATVPRGGYGPRWAALAQRRAPSQTPPSRGWGNNPW